MKPNDRRLALVDFVRDLGRVSVETLAAKLNTSKETVRRDLAELSDRGLIKKYHGGALAPEAAGEGPFKARMAQNMPQKRTIARCASALFRSGDTLFVDTGSTTVVFAEELANIFGITVITNSQTITSIMARGSGDARIFSIGGEYRDEAAENVGPLAIEQISRFSAQHAILTVAAINSDGVMDFNLEEAEVARAMIARASEVTILLDSSKFEKTALFSVCSLATIDRVICEDAPSPKLRDALRRAAVDIIVAEVEWEARIERNRARVRATKKQR